VSGHWFNVTVYIIDYANVRVLTRVFLYWPLVMQVSRLFGMFCC